MRSDNKIPEIGTIVNNRKYIGGLESKYVSGHKRNFITVKCLECGLEVHIESKGFRKYGCKCNQLKSIKIKHGFAHYGQRNRFYNIFCGIKSRCKGTACKQRRHLYFGKGIKCEWDSFEEFKNDMYQSYLDHVEKYGEKDTTIDRIDGDGNYCKENCRWATCKEQSNNTKKTHKINIDGKIYMTPDIALLTGVSMNTACHRLCDYSKGKITKEQLFAKRKSNSPYTSIYPPATTTAATANG